MRAMKRLAWLALMLAVSCGGARTTATTTPAGEGAATGDVPPEGMAFEDMTKNQRIVFMKETVLPAMAKEFASVDPKFAEMDCKTCHGKSAEDKTFKMPNPDLPHLPTTPEGFARIKEEKPKILAFMLGTVKPKMAALLKEPEYDPATKSGEFGCPKCHVMGEGTP
jgi:hypothetical protein